LLPFRSIGSLAADELEGELKAIYEEEAFGEWRGKAQQELESFGGGDRADDGGSGRHHGEGGLRGAWGISLISLGEEVSVA
jgi:hypothetical protein